MKKKMIIATVLAVATIFTAVVVTAEPTTAAFAANQKNEYGCTGNCTGQYEIRHVKSILMSDPSKNGSQNVRFKVKYNGEWNGYKTFVDQDESILSTFAIGSDPTKVMVCTDGMFEAKVGFTNYQVGDIVDIAGTVNYTSQNIGVKTLVLTSMVVWGVNGMMNTGLLQPVNYIA